MVVSLNSMAPEVQLGDAEWARRRWRAVPGTLAPPAAARLAFRNRRSHTSGAPMSARSVPALDAAGSGRRSLGVARAVGRQRRPIGSSWPSARPRAVGGSSPTRRRRSPQIRSASPCSDRGLGPDRPLLILAENGIDHALMMLGAMHVGVPVVPVSTAYARLSQGLRQAALHLRSGRARPDLRRRGRPLRQGAASAIGATGVEIVASRGSLGASQLTPFSALTRRAPTPRGGRRVRARSGPTRWPRSCSPRARPASPRA